MAMDPRDVTEAIVAVAMAKVVSPAVEMETAKAVVAVVLVGTVATAAAVAATAVPAVVTLATEAGMAGTAAAAAATAAVATKAVAATAAAAMAAVAAMVAVAAAAEFATAVMAFVVLGGDSAACLQGAELKRLACERRRLSWRGPSLNARAQREGQSPALRG